MVAPTAPNRPSVPTIALLRVVSVVLVSVPVAGMPVAFPLLLMVLGETVVMTVVFGLGVVTVVPLWAALDVDVGAGAGATTDGVGASTGAPGTAAGASPGVVCAPAVKAVDAPTTAIAAIGGIRRNLMESSTR